MAFGKKAATYRGSRSRSPLLNHRFLLGGGLFALAALFVLGQFGDNGVASWWKLRAEEAKLEKEVSDLEQANAAMNAKLEKLASDPATLEKLAREKHKMRRPDEEVLTVLDRSTDPSRNEQ